jgi:hypothetical protein
LCHKHSILRGVYLFDGKISLEEKMLVKNGDFFHLKNRTENV